MKYQVAYANVYGNAEVLASWIMSILPPESAELVNLSYRDISSDADVYLIGFEITQDTIPLNIMDVLEKLEGKTILCFAACGMADSGNKERVERNLRPFLPDECDYRGLFLCPGQIPTSVIDTIQKVLDENPDNERAKAMLEGFQHSLNHPDMEDFRDLRRFIDGSGI